MHSAENLNQLLRRATRENPQAPAFRYRDEVIDYATWDRLSAMMSARLAAGGLRRGDVVALLLPSIPLYHVTYLAAARLGAITTGINTRYRRTEMAHILRHSQAHTLVAVRAWHGADFVAAIEAVSGELPHLRDILWLEPEEACSGTVAQVVHLAEGCVDPPPVDVTSDEPLAIVFTSGTTGTPKGACYTHGAVLALAEIETRRYPGGEIPFRKHLAAGLSFAHVGTMARIGIQLGHIGVSILHDSFDPALVLETIERERLVHLGGIPTQIILLLEHPDFGRRDLSSLRSLLLGGAPASAELIRRVADAFHSTVSVRYSSTEVGIATASLADDPPEILTTTVGKPTPGVELRIVDARNQPLPAGEVGEVVVRSPATMSCYWRAPELTARVIDGEGWVHTGDLGALDGMGYLRLSGRQSEMYIRGGYNVFPEEIENRLVQHPKVARAGVVGAPDPTFGEVGIAFVVPRSAGEPPTLSELRSFVGDELASFKRPDRLEIVGQLPLTPMFKIDRRALRELAAERSR